MLGDYSNENIQNSLLAFLLAVFDLHPEVGLLLLVRLNQSRKLLRQGNSGLSLAQIAAASGFCDQAHLNQQFRRFFGTTPAAFRSQQVHS